MSMTTDLERIGRNDNPAARTERVGQATAIEQSRAVAEVQAAIIVAQQVPRNLPAAREAMLEACRQPALAKRAFYRYSRGGEQVTGPTVHLARELARCFGNMQYGLVELSRDDDDQHQSQMLAFAWDVQTNTRATTTVIVPHGRDTRQGRKVLTELRDIYENNANNGSRRLREQILAVLPEWLVEEAKAQCLATLSDGGGKPLAVRVTEALGWFRGLSVTQQQLEEKLGLPVARWTTLDLAALEVVSTSIHRHETTVEAEFPTRPVTADELGGAAAAAAAPSGSASSEDVGDEPPAGWQGEPVEPSVRGTGRAR